jgi:hypothetical protein
MGSSGNFAICSCNSWKTSSIGTWSGIWKKIWLPNGSVGSPCRKPTPDYSLFTRVRTRIGPTRLSQLFATMREQLKAAGLMSEAFTFVDATHLIGKATLWEERDKARQQKSEKVNNEVLPKVAVDKQAQIGCQGKKKYWYGYKEHVRVDMQSGLINKRGDHPGHSSRGARPAACLPHTRGDLWG